MPCLTCGAPTRGKPLCPDHAEAKVQRGARMPTLQLRQGDEVKPAGRTVRVMTDPRCNAGLHHYPKPGKDHPVSTAEATAGRVTLECSRCHKTKTIEWKPGPPKPDHDPPIDFGGGWGGG